MPMRLPLVALAMALLLAACAGGNTAPKAPAARSVTKTGTNEAGRAVAVSVVRGSVVGPVGYKPGKLAPLAGNKAYALRQAKDENFKEAPIAGVQVYLASQKGERFKGPTVGTTDAKGEFVINNVPVGLSYLVMTNTEDARQTDGEMCAPHFNQEAAPVRISFSSTMVTLNTLQTMTGNALGQFQTDLFIKLNAAVEAKLTTLKMAELPNLRDPAAIQAFMGAVTIDGKPANELVASLRTSLQANGVDATKVQAALDQLEISFAGSGQASVNGGSATGGEGSGTITLPPDLASQIFGGLGGAPATPAPTPTASAAP